MSIEAVCYTREGALRKVIELLQKNYEAYLKAYLVSYNHEARELIKRIALEELGFKCALEKALLGETISFQADAAQDEIIVKLPSDLKKDALDENSTPQDVLLYAINNKKCSVVFYATMAFQCAEAPMEHLFKKLLKEETVHLAHLKELYESSHADKTGVSP
jgi:rubrerythrin